VKGISVTPTCFFSLHRQMSRLCYVVPDQDADCGICLRKLSKARRVLQLPCNHCFHGPCINQWQQKTCPLCRFSYFFTAYHFRHRAELTTRNKVDKLLYRYNKRFHRTVYNLVLFELRRYQWYCKRMIPFKARKKARRRAKGLMQSDEKFSYFHHGNNPHSNTTNAS
jgi:hypothetical protein